jgi:hypothetical protein
MCVIQPMEILLKQISYTAGNVTTQTSELNDRQRNYSNMRVIQPMKILLKQISYTTGKGTTQTSVLKRRQRFIDTKLTYLVKTHCVTHIFE